MSAPTRSSSDRAPCVDPPETRYRLVASYYDRLGKLYSGGAIEQSKLAAIEYLAPGSRVLIVGAGNGREAVVAAQAGHHVIVLDNSAAMLAHAKKQFNALPLQLQSRIELVLADARTYRCEQPVDALFLHYFLNVFDHASGRQLLLQLVNLVGTDGIISIADFAPASKHRFIASLQWGYYLFVLCFFWLVTKNAWRPLTDHSDWLPANDYIICARRQFPIYGIGPRWYEALIFRKL